MITRTLTEDEAALLQHIMLWGSDGYPIEKLGRRWHWRKWRGIYGSPIVYKTKQAAIDAFERYHQVLLDVRAGRYLS